MYLYLKGIFSTQPNSWVLCFPSSTWQYLSFNWRAESIYFQWMYRCSWIEVYQLASCFCLICLIFFSSFLKKFIHNTLLLRLLSVVNYLLKELRKQILKSLILPVVLIPHVDSSFYLITFFFQPEEFLVTFPVVCLLVRIPLSFYLKMCWFCPHFLKDIFVGYRIVEWQLFLSFNTLEINIQLLFGFHCFWWEVSNSALFSGWF